MHTTDGCKPQVVRGASFTASLTPHCSTGLLLFMPPLLACDRLGAVARLQSDGHLWRGHALHKSHVEGSVPGGKNHA